MKKNLHIKENYQERSGSSKNRNLQFYLKEIAIFGLIYLAIMIYAILHRMASS